MADSTVEQLRRRNVAKPDLGAPPTHPDDQHPQNPSTATPPDQHPQNPSAATPVEIPSAPGTFTEDDLSIRPDVSARINEIMRQGISYAHRHQGTVQGESMLDDTIYQMRLMGLNTREIAQKLGGSVTEEEVARRIGMMLARMDDLTPAEYRRLQVGRLEAVVNFLWSMARGGSADHIELLLKAIERLNKMFELENEKSKVEIELITTHQASLLMSLVGGVLQVILGDRRVLEALGREEINSLAARALDSAEHGIIEASGQVLVQANDPAARSAGKLVLSQRA